MSEDNKEAIISDAPVEHKIILEQEVDIPSDYLFTMPTIYTGTLIYYYIGTSKTAEELVKILEPEGEVKVINTNFGSKSQSGWEFKQVTKRKTPKPKKHPDGSDKINIVRKIQGHGGCFGSALELIIVPNPETSPESILVAAKQKYDELAKVRKNKTNEMRQKYYVSEVFPSAAPIGKMQIMGITDQKLENGRYIADICAAFLNKDGVNDNMENPIKILLGFSTLVNYKFKLDIAKLGDDYKFNIDDFVEILNRTKANPPEDLPFVIIHINPVSEKQIASFRIKMKNPKLIVIPQHVTDMEDGIAKVALIDAIKKNNIKHMNSGTNIKFWYTGKVNILNARNYDAAYTIFKFFDDTVRANREQLLFIA
jgi:hypothetical protein